jgi:DNA-binding Lrp family transcriptional regulator
MVRADRKLFRLLSDDVCRDLLDCLLGKDGPQTQAQLTKALSLNSSTVSRRIGQLEEEGVVEQRGGKRGPYKVVFPLPTRKLLEEASELASLLASTHEQSARELHSRQRREALAGGHLHDRASEGGA